jgi:hypothetical protein
MHEGVVKVFSTTTPPGETGFDVAFLGDITNSLVGPSGGLGKPL